MDDLEDAAEIAAKVKSGEYFREARAMYDIAVHDPMAERYLYVAITAVAALCFLIAYIGIQGLYPLAPKVPFIVATQDIIEDVPRIHSLLAYKGENPDEAIMRFLVKNYVNLREEYSIDTFDRDVNGVKSQSSDAAFNEFESMVDPRSPDSPVTLYQRHSTRSIEVLSTKRLPSQPGKDQTMQVTYAASVETGSDIKKTYWQSDIAFHYTGIALDDKTQKVKPFTFMVTRYHSQRLQDIE